MDGRTGRRQRRLVEAPVPRLRPRPLEGDGRAKVVHVIDGSVAVVRVEVDLDGATEGVGARDKCDGDRLVDVADR